MLFRSDLLLRWVHPNNTSSSSSSSLVQLDLMILHLANTNLYKALQLKLGHNRHRRHLGGLHAHHHELV